MRNKIVLILAFVLSGYMSAFAQQEEITITAYYPSPYGVYSEMAVTNRQAVGDVNGDSLYNNADMAVDQFGAPIPGSLTVAGSVGIGKKSLQVIQDGRNLDLDVVDNIVADDIYLRNPQQGVARWASQQVALDYAQCTTVNVGQPSGPHRSYCPQGYVVVGGSTDGNDWIWEDIICCKIEGLSVVNWASRP